MEIDFPGYAVGGLSVGEPKDLLFEIADFIEFVVDDNPCMRGLFMPGSKLPIFESKMVYEKDIKLCILTLSAPSEEKVVKNNQKFLEQGGEFISIFSGSPRAKEVKRVREYEKSF